MEKAEGGIEYEGNCRGHRGTAVGVSGLWLLKIELLRMVVGVTAVGLPVYATTRITYEYVTSCPVTTDVNARRIWCLQQQRHAKAPVKAAVGGEEKVANGADREQVYTAAAALLSMQSRKWHAPGDRHSQARCQPRVPALLQKRLLTAVRMVLLLTEQPVQAQK